VANPVGVDVAALREWGEEGLDDGAEEEKRKVEQLRADKEQKRFTNTQQEAELALMNKRHAFIENYGGKAMVTDFLAPDDDSPRQCVVFVDTHAIRERYANRFVPGSEKKAVGDWWLKHPKRRQYKGTRFDPGGPEVALRNGDVYLNLWQGWAIDAKQGDWSLMHAHIDEVIAAGDPKMTEYILRWCAWMVQNPGKPAEVALVLRGDKGSGKGTLTKTLLRFFGQHGMQISEPEQLTGKHNGHFRACVLLIADEAYWAGDKKAEGALKRLITEPSLTIEPKFVNAYAAMNRLHLIITANADWVVPASPKERRFAASDVSEEKIGDAAYFKALNAELDGGGAAAMLHDLLALPLDDWHPREVYTNDALRRQQAESLRGFQGFYGQMLQEGVIPGAEKDRPYLVRFDTLFDKGKKDDPFGIGRMSGKAFAAELDKFSIRPKRTGAVRYREFPPLSEARATFSGRFRGGWRWQNEIEGWSAEGEIEAIMARPADLIE
jgi:hypothetical protein